MEETGFEIVCGAPTTLAVKGLMMMMMMAECSSRVGELSKERVRSFGESGLGRVDWQLVPVPGSWLVLGL